MVKPSTVGAFFASMLVTTALTASSYLGVYLLVTIHEETKKYTALGIPSVETQKPSVLRIVPEERGSNLTQARAA